MIKIIKSLAMIGVVAAVGLTMTGAYFSDTEKSVGNIMQAGSLDLFLNDTNGDETVVVVNIDDMKPCQVEYSAPIKLHITNNPGRIYKKIVVADDNIYCGTNGTTEPECEAEGGVWGASGCSDDDSTTPSWVEKNYLPEVTWFDLAIWVTDPLATTIVEPNGDQNANPDPICGTTITDGTTITTITTDCWKTLIPDGKITVAQIAGKQIDLGGDIGDYPAGSTIIIRQSFHMKAEATNEYQSDSCTFTEEFKVLQVNDDTTPVGDICTPDLNTGCAV